VPVEPALVLAWLVGRSVARGLPPPIAHRDGFRVETGSEQEVRRWVFAHACEELAALGREIEAPRHFLKLCDEADVLRAALPPRWEIRPLSYVMTADGDFAPEVAIPQGYVLERHAGGCVTHIRIIAGDGTVAASGYAAETTKAFVYDRIETAPAHRRLGLGRAVMAALGVYRKSNAVPQLLVATE